MRPFWISGRPFSLKKMKSKRIILLLMMVLFLCACESKKEETVTDDVIVETEEKIEDTGEDENMLKMMINETEVRVNWEDNEAVAELKKLVSGDPLEVDMSMYGGFEQVGYLGTDLPRNDKQTSTSSGDIVLYSGDQIVVFYGSNSWAYTRLGHIEDKSNSEMKDLLSNGDVTIRLYTE